MSEDQVTEGSVEQKRLRLLGEIRAARGTSANVSHTPSGRFAAGNPGGPGNPHAGQVAKLRAVLLDAVTEEDMRTVVGKLVEMAKGGDLKAIELLLNRTLGKADGGPLVAIQNNQSEPGRAGRVLARLRAERGRQSGGETIDVASTDP